MEMKHVFEVEVSKKTIRYLLIIIPFIPNVLGDVYHNIYLINMIWKICSFLIISMNYSREVLLRRKASKLFYVGLLDMIMLLISTIINDGSITKYFGYFISCIGLLMLFEFASNKSEEKKLITALLYYLRISLIIDAILLIVYPKGMFGTTGNNRLTFLGLDNISVPVVICFLVLSIMFNYSKRKKMDVVAIFDVCLVIFILLFLFSGTGLLAFAVFITFAFVLKNMKPKKKVMIGLLMCSLIFVYFYFIQDSSVISNLVQLIFGKDITLSGRTVIWYEYLSNIKKFFWLGMGIQETNQAFFYIPTMWDYRLAHNEALQHLADGGIVYLTLFIIMILMSSIKKKGNKYTKKNQITSAGVVAFLCMFITESYLQNNIFFIVLYLLYFNYELAIGDQ